MEIEQKLAEKVGRTIGEALKQRVERGLDSQRAAAERAGISEGWWRQIVNGGAMRSGVWVAARSNPRTYLAMAREVGVENEVRSLLGDLAPPVEVDMTRPSSIGSVVEVDDEDARHFRDTIAADRHLHEDARQHLLNQYDLLRRIPPVSDRRDREGATRPLRAVARKRPNRQRGV